MCNHCKANVENGIAKIPGVTAVEVDLSTGIAYIEGKDYNSSEVIETIKSLGYKYIE